MTPGQVPHERRVPSKTGSVARVGNLLYRRMAFCEPTNGTWAVPAAVTDTLNQTHQRHGVQVPLWLILLLLISLGVTGCTSMYHRTRKELPPDPAAELELRVAEATRAHKIAEQAGRKLLQNLQRQKSGTGVQFDFDRLEAAAYELERRVLAIENARARCESFTKFEADVNRLRQQTETWLQYVKNNRDAEPAAQFKHLRPLLP